MIKLRLVTSTASTKSEPESITVKSQSKCKTKPP